LYWINNAFKLKEEHFEETVNEALRKVIYKNEKKSQLQKSPNVSTSKNKACAG